MSRAVLLVAGDLSINERVRETVQNANLIVAADGGARHALALGVRPDCWVGDFDSSDAALQDALRDVPQQRLSPNKDQTDLELALALAKTQGATSAVVLGAFGGRFDHALAIAQLAVQETLAGFEIRLESGHEHALVVTPGAPVLLPVRPKQTFSLLPMLGDARVLGLRGAKWELVNTTLPFGAGLGVSNVAQNEVYLQLAQGVVLVVIQDHSNV